MPEQPVQLGIIGLGHIGKYHIRAIRQFQEINLVAVCDRQKEFASLAPKSVEFYSDYQEMLRDERVKTVVIATPNHTHNTIANHALAAGKCVILEKPAAESMPELEQLERTAKREGLSIYYAFHAACAFDVEWFVQYYHRPEIRDELGPITGFYSRFYDPYVEKGNLLSEAEGLQDCWLDSGINAISVIQRFIDVSQLTIENVSAAINYNKIPKFLQCHAEFSFTINGKDRSGMGVIDTNWTTGRNHKSTVLTFARSCNAIRIDHSRQKIYRRFPDGKESELEDLSGGEDRLYNHYIGVFKDYLTHRSSGVMNGNSSIAAHRLLFKAKESINHNL